MASSNQSLISIAPSSISVQPGARFSRFAVSAATLNALLAARLLTWWHSSFSQPPTFLVLPACAYIAVSALAAVATARYWNRARLRTRLSTRELVMAWIAGWVWAPAIVLLERRDSLWAPLLTALAAALPACAMHWLSVRTIAADQPATHHEPAALFEETLRPVPWDFRGMWVAVCIYAAVAAYTHDDTLLSCALAAAATFLFAARRAEAWDAHAATLSSDRNARIRLLYSLALAILITTLALIPGLQRTFGGIPVPNIAPAKKSPANVINPGLGDYSSIILWPMPPRKQILAPVNPLAAATLTATKTIRFTGPYWYFQAPELEPGPQAHVAHGNPLDASIHTVNRRPLMMQAHQDLGAPVSLSSVGEVDVAMENRDNEPGVIQIEVQLIDISAIDKSPITLGMLPLASSQPEHFAPKTASVEETLRFKVPRHVAIRRFDRINVVIHPDVHRIEDGVKVAIDHFDLLPH